MPALHDVPVEPGAVDVGDLALALSFVLRRVAVTTTMLPGLVKRPQVFALEEMTPLLAVCA